MRHQMRHQCPKNHHPIHPHPLTLSTLQIHLPPFLPPLGFESRPDRLLKACITGFFHLYPIHVAPIVALLAAVLRPKFEVKSKPSEKYTLPHLVDRGGDITKRWYITYWIFDEDLGEKVRVRVTHTINDYNTKRERYAVATEMMAAITQYLKSGKYEKIERTDPASKGPATITELIDRYVRHIGASSSLSTLNYYRAMADHLRESGVKENRIYKFSKTHAIQFQEYLRYEELASKTINNYLKALNTCLFFAVKNKWLKENPMQYFDYERVIQGESNVPYNLEQLAQIKEIGKAWPDYLLFCNFNLYTLARPWKEILLLKISDIKEQTIYFPGARVKSGRKKFVEIVPPLQRIIQENNLRAMPPDWYVFGSEGKPGPQPVYKRLFYELHVKVLQKMDLFGRGYGMYSMKPTGAYFMRKLGVPIETISQLMGHKDLRTTEIYFRNMGVLLKADPTLAKIPDFWIF